MADVIVEHTKLRQPTPSVVVIEHLAFWLTVDKFVHQRKDETALMNALLFIVSFQTSQKKEESVSFQPRVEVSGVRQWSPRTDRRGESMGSPSHGSPVVVGHTLLERDSQPPLKLPDALPRDAVQLADVIERPVRPHDAVRHDVAPTRGQRLKPGGQHVVVMHGDDLQVKGPHCLPPRPHVRRQRLSCRDGIDQVSERSAAARKEGPLGEQVEVRLDRLDRVALIPETLQRRLQFGVGCGIVPYGLCRPCGIAKGGQRFLERPQQTEGLVDGDFPDVTKIAELFLRDFSQVLTRLNPALDQHGPYPSGELRADDRRNDLDRLVDQLAQDREAVTERSRLQAYSMVLPDLRHAQRSSPSRSHR